MKSLCDGVAKLVVLSSISKIDEFTVEIMLPDGVKLLSGQRFNAYDQLHNAKTVKIPFSFALADDDEYKVVAAVTTTDTETLVIRKAIVLIVNEKPKSKENIEVVKDAKGDELIVY